MGEERRESMQKKYYCVEEIKNKFKSYRDLENSDITDEEYEMFCDAIQILPMKIVDKINVEIEFALLSAHSNKGNPACYINIKGLDERKKGIIFITPHVFGAPYSVENCKEKKIIGTDRQKKILHEIAHHYLGHIRYNNAQDKEEKENDADELVKRWVGEWANYTE